MENTLRNELLRYISERQQGKTDLAEEIKIMKYALTILIEYCTIGMRILTPDRNYMENILFSEMLSNNTLKRIRSILFSYNLYAYDELIGYFKVFRSKILRLYNKYFQSCTYETAKGLYNHILDMYWNPEEQIWQKVTDDGWVKFTAFDFFVDD